MDLGELEELIRRHVGAELAVDPAAIGTEADLRGMPGADSVRLLRVVAAVEDECDVELPDDVVFGISTIGDLARALDASLVGDPRP